MGGVSFYHRLGDPAPYLFQSGKVFFRLVFSSFFLSYTSFFLLAQRYDSALSTGWQRGNFSLQPYEIMPVSSTILLVE